MPIRKLAPGQDYTSPPPCPDLMHAPTSLLAAALRLEPGRYEYTCPTCNTITRIGVPADAAIRHG